MGFKAFLIWIGKAMMPAPLKLVVSVISFTLPGSYYKDVEPILYTLKLFGRLPVSITDKGLERCSLISWTWLYTGIFLAVQISMTLVGIHQMIGSMNRSEDYDEYLFWLMLILILGLNIIVPATFWNDACLLTRYLHQWTTFQNEFFSFAKGPLSKMDFLEEDVKAGSKNYIFWMSVFNVPFVSSVVTIEALFFVKMPLIVVFPYIMIFSSIFSGVLFWCSTCRQIMRIADVLIEKTVMAIKKDKTDELIWCRRCWIRLSGLTSGLGSALKHSSLVTTIIMSVSFVISMYACLSVFTRSMKSEYFLGIITEIPITLIILLLIFNYSNNVSYKVGQEFGCKMLSLDLSNLSPASIVEVNIFLQSLSLSPPIVKLADYVVVDKRLVTSFASSVITYLIVLLQFRESSSRVNQTQLTANNTS